MNKTTNRTTSNPLTVDTKGLAALLSCGTATARRIGEEAEAKIVIGRRVLYSVNKVQEYVNKIAI